MLVLTEAAAACTGFAIVIVVLVKFTRHDHDQTDRNFYRNFLINSDNGRSSLRITNTFSLEVASVELEATGNNIRLHLEPKMPLISAEEPLPPRGGMYFAPASRLSRIIRQANHCAIL